MSTENKQDPQQLFNSLWEGRDDKNSPEPESSEIEQSEIEPSENDSTISPMEAFEQLEDTPVSEDNKLAADENSEEESKTSLPSSATETPDSEKDIEEFFVKGPNGRKQKVKIDYSDRKAIKKAHQLAAGMRKFQVERDAKNKLIKPLEDAFNQQITEEVITEIVSLKKDFDRLESVFSEKGAKGLVTLLGGGDEAWQKAVEEELEHREYVNNLTAEEKYQLEMKKVREEADTKLAAEKKQREQFQQQVESEREHAELRALESKLHPAFERYRFAGKLGDTETENLYDEAIWEKVKKRLAEYDDNIELNQAVIDKHFREVSNKFRKHIKTQAEKKFKKTVENKKAETAQRAQVAAKKGLSGSTQQRKILESLKQGNLGDALGLWNQSK